MKKTMNSLEVMEFLVEKFDFEMKYVYEIKNSGAWTHAAVHDYGEQLVEVFDRGTPSYWIGMRVNGKQYELGNSGYEHLIRLNTKKKILHEFKKLGFIPNEKTLTPCEIQDYLVANYSFQRSNNTSGWGYYIYNTSFNKDLFHDKNARFLGFGNRVSPVHGDNVYESINTIPALKAFADKHFTKEVLMKEKLLDSHQIMEIAARDYGFILECNEFCWSHTATLNNGNSYELYDNAPSLWLGFRKDSDLIFDGDGSKAWKAFNSEAKLHAEFAKLGILKVLPKPEEEILTPINILNLAAMDYGFKLGRGSTKNGINWDHMAILEGDSTIKLFCVNDTTDGAYIGTEFNGYQPKGTGWEKYKELNTANKFHAWCSLNGIKSIDEILSPSELITLAQTEYGFKPVKELWGNHVSWDNMVALNGSKQVVLFHDLNDCCQRWIGVEVNREYQINSRGLRRWEQLNTKRKFATWFKSLNIKKETVSEVNNNYEKKVQPILWTTMADGSRIVGVGERGKYVIKHHWCMRKDAKLTSASHQYTLTLNDERLLLGTQASSSVDGAIQFANAHNLS